MTLYALIFQNATLDIRRDARHCTYFFPFFLPPPQNFCKQRDDVAPNFFFFYVPPPEFLPAQRAILGAMRDVATVTAGVGVGVSGGGGARTSGDKRGGGRGEGVGGGGVGGGERANVRISGMQTGFDALSGVPKP